MMTINKTVSLSLLALTIGPAALAQPLTDLQKAQLAGVLSAEAGFNQLIQTELKKHSSALTQTGDTPPDYKPIEDNCQINVIPPAKKGELSTPDGQKKLPLFTVDITGTSCPLTVHASVDGVQADDGFDAQLAIEGMVHSDEMKKEHDVDQFHVSMDFSAHMKKQGDGQNAPVLTTFALHGSGTGHSQKAGAFRQSAKLAGSFQLSPSSQADSPMPDMSMAMSELLGYDFGGFSAELKSDVAMKSLLGPSDEHYYLNGDPISKDEYMKYRSEVQLPVDQDPQSGPQQPLPGQPNPSLGQCHVVVYDATQVSLMELNQAIQTGMPIAAPALLDRQSCGQMGAWNFQHGSDGVTVLLSFQPENVDLTVTVDQRENSSLSFLLDQSSDQADQVGGYTYRMKCDPVPTCQ